MASVGIENVSILSSKQGGTALKVASQNVPPSENLAQTGAVSEIYDCTLQVREGETLVLTGPSGSGQSTLLRTVNGLARPACGHVIVSHEGRAFYVNTLRVSELQSLRTNLVSMVFHPSGLLPWRSVMGNVGLGLEIAGVRKAQCRTLVMEQLELAGLSQWADKPAKVLSDDMQQRVGLARAFATGAPVLLMDKPFSAFDFLPRKHLQDTLLAMQCRLRKTIVFVSHDPEEAVRMGNRIVVMHNGRIIQTGTPQDVVLSPVDERVAEFMRPVNPLTFLTAADIMRPYDRATAHQAVSAMARPKTSLKDLVQALQRASGNIGIVENGAIVGTVSTEDIIAHLGTRKKC